MRATAAAACFLACGAGAAAAAACAPGEEACPVMLTPKPGASVIRATGFVSGEHPDYYVSIVAEAGQTLAIHTVGGGLKTGPGIPITGPNGFEDAVDEDAPYALPASGTYTIDFHANTMSEGPFGRFQIVLTIR